MLLLPWTARRSNQSILKEISPGCSLEGLMLRLKLQYFGLLMQRIDSLERLWCWEGLGAGGEGDDRGWDGWMASLTWWMWVWVNSGSWWWTGRPGILRFMGSQRVRHDWVIELNRTEMMLVLTRSVCAQSCLTLWDHMNCHPPGSSVSGILQARILEWVAIPFSRRYSWFKDRTWIFCIIGRFFIIWTTRDYKSDNFNMSAWIHLA